MFVVNATIFDIMGAIDLHCARVADSRHPVPAVLLHRLACLERVERPLAVCHACLAALDEGHSWQSNYFRRRRLLGLLDNYLHSLA